METAAFVLGESRTDLDRLIAVGDLTLPPPPAHHQVEVGELIRRLHSQADAVGCALLLRLLRGQIEAAVVKGASDRGSLLLGLLGGHPRGSS